MDECNYMPRPLPTIREEAGKVFATSYMLVKRLFSYLGYHDLVIASQVCKDWRDVVRIIKKRRILRYVIAHPNHIFSTKLENVYRPNRLSQLQMLDKNLREMLPKLDPKNPLTYYCFGFTVGRWLQRKNIVTRSSPNGGTLSEAINSLLSKDSELVLVEASGIVGSVEDPDSVLHPPLSEEQRERDIWYFRHSPSRVSHSVEVENSIPRVVEEGHLASLCLEPIKGFSLVFIPKQLGVKIRMFKLCEKEFFQTYRPNFPVEERKFTKNPVTRNELDSMLDFRTEERLKSFLLISSIKGPYLRSVVQAVLERENNKVALGGGFVDRVQQLGDPFQGAVGIAISGDNVVTASIVIPSSVRDETALSKEISKLKARGLPEGHTFAFMFACLGRGAQWYKKSHLKYPHGYACVESRVFRSYFPNTPLFGFFGGGEIGINFYDLEEDLRARKRRRTNIPCFHQYCTVFVLFSIR